MSITRSRTLNDKPYGNGPVVYWMQRDQRVGDNWALLHAQELAMQRRLPLVVVFCLANDFLGATSRHFNFMLAGLKDVEESLTLRNIPFYILNGAAPESLPRFVQQVRASALVTDFNPLKLVGKWKEEVNRAITIPFLEIDAHNIIPCWIASPKLEFGARTIRGKIQKLLPDYLVPFPDVQVHPFSLDVPIVEKITGNISKETLSRPTGTLNAFPAGEKSAMLAMKNFIQTLLPRYHETRNFPDQDGQSGLSPWLHFGHLSAQRIALEVIQAIAPTDAKTAFMEELIVRRELSDNFCFYNPDYDRFDGFPTWAQKSLNKHRPDTREFLYDLEAFENAATHDPLWNAAQLEMVKTGKMHGYMRMYWAKKILEWTVSPEEAMTIAIYLNDKYELDGRDPNGYAGIAWSIGGVHDRPWGERPVYGQIRYMNYNGCKRKFDVKAYITSSASRL
jgi:deoxyribodipyrimidine photo-lyase